MYISSHKIFLVHAPYKDAEDLVTFFAVAVA